MTLKILRWNVLTTKPEEIQSEMEAELNALQSFVESHPGMGKVSWQIQGIGYQLWCFITTKLG